MITGFLLLLVGELLFLMQNDQIQKQKYMEIEKVETFIEEQQSYAIPEKSHDTPTQKSDYVAVIEIPKIGLKKGLFDVNSTQNNVNQNIQMMRESDYPNIENGNMILVGHSGIGAATYFNHLDQLDLGDLVSIYYQGVKYIYQIDKIYDVEKTGRVSIKREDSTTTLTLITCRFRTNQQLVVIAKQIKQEPMYSNEKRENYESLFL